MKVFHLLLLFVPFTMLAQKKIIDHTVYNDWKKLGDAKITDQGKFSIYTIKPHRGDGFLYIVNNETGKKDSIARGINPLIAGDESFIAFKITPGFDTLRACEIAKIKKEKWPKDSLGIYFLATQKLEKIEKVKSFYVSSTGSWLYYLIDGNKLNLPTPKKKFFKRKIEEKKYESDGNVLVICNPNTNFKLKTKDVKQVYTPSKGNFMAYTKHQKDKIDSFSIHIFNQESSANYWDIPMKFSTISTISWNEEGTEIAFTASKDTSKVKISDLYYARLKTQTLTKLIDTTQVFFSKKLAVSSNKIPHFSKDGKRLFFGIAALPTPESPDTLLESEKVKLDLWSWEDDRLQPQQLVELEEDSKQTQFAVYLFDSSKALSVGGDSLTIQMNDHGNATYALGICEKPYQRYYNWEYPSKKDYYLIAIQTGETKLLKQGISNGLELSPSGRYGVYQNSSDLQQYLIDNQTGKENCITCQTSVQWNEDVNGMAQTPPPFGVIGWTKNEAALLIQSNYDCWSYALSEKQLHALTERKGEQAHVRFRVQMWEKDSTYLEPENLYITGFFEKDKSMSLYSVSMNARKWQLNEQFHTAHDLTGFKKAKKGENYLFQKSSVAVYPDLQLAAWNNKREAQQISTTNPQQAAYNWATVELIAWKSYAGIPLEGLLYKPENYDSTRKYPLLVYYYETYSDELHNHYAPKPTASIIYPTEYASAGYFVLIPDIRYQLGHPAKSAYDCVLSATDFVLKKYPAIDSSRMGLQGQSWGGYQTAQLITMTKRYKAAMAGAPVGNMFSAYGGIRWGSGLNRQFQYEKTQSRIGKTIWEAPELYIENSPIFHLPKVQTPLLIMHNDADGSVPWYQGIELFTDLKRLNKPVWMLNYNDDDHNLMKNANRMDLSIRMRQFFDYYLQNKPAPTWLIEGIPAIEKGKQLRLD
jgi:dipeptidyl aminopeptidase/acylaminoacyl peptidase